MNFIKLSIYLYKNLQTTIILFGVNVFLLLWIASLVVDKYMKPLKK